MEDPNPSLPGQGNSQSRLGHCVHGCGDQGDIDSDSPSEPCGDVYLSRMDLRFGWKEQDVVEGEPLFQRPV